MKISTIQISAEDALRAVADGKSVQMIWTNAGEPVFLNFNQKIADLMRSGDAFLMVEIDEGESEPERPETELKRPETESNDRKTESNDTKSESNDDISNTVITDPDTTPITVKIPNSHKAEKERQRKLDDERIIALRKSGLSEFKIAEAMDSSQNTIHYHIAKLKKEGRL